ncbi:glycosyltransferase family 2 protein [Leptospira langatensis]|uniref:Glycosyltransferase family 2 protein n=1 Tax=Leptospira langatensis TaxID=2484983 RepID=A0A5F1ZQ18_9LEPT|nr:glycosyltransferase family 2 protein [Leptospira langatensis]TGK05620.1 glycosyltransferase family 2 protein [Leptospira langatensis]TGL38751.1 glycosyltransferase family 2 protein [Leptospira langatensis]
MTPSVSVILPTYNESENLPIAADRISKSLSGFKHEIIVVDDDSPDHTWEIAENLQETIPQLRVIRRLTGKGLSSAVLTGMGAAEGEVFVVMDSDLQHDEKILPEMIRSFYERDVDLCLGTRYAKGGSTGKWSWARIGISRFANFLAKRLLGLPVSDPMSGYFGIKRSVYSETVNEINPRGFKILLEFLGRSKEELKIEEIPYTFQTRVHGKTKLNNSVIKNFFLAVLDIRFGKWISPTFLLYCIVGATGVIVNLLGFLLGEALDFPELISGYSILDPVSLSVLFGIELSIVSNFLLNNYFTFYERRYSDWKLPFGFALFHSVSLFGILVQILSFHFIYQSFLSEIKVVNAFTLKFASDILSILIAMLSNYFLNSNLTWSRRQEGNF